MSRAKSAGGRNASGNRHMRWVTLLVLLPTAAAGCTHRQLSRSTVATTSTVMEIEYRTVLNNLAMFSRHPETLPNHVRVRDGVVQIDDGVGVGTSGGLTTFNGSVLGVDRYEPSGSRHVTEQWGMDAVCDPRTVKALQDIYRTARGLPPLPDPTAVADAARSMVSSGQSGESESAGPEGSTPPIPVAILLADVPPPGWYHVGGKRTCPTTPATWYYSVS